MLMEDCNERRVYVEGVVKREKQLDAFEDFYRWIYTHNETIRLIIRQHNGGVRSKGTYGALLHSSRCGA